jgi:adenosylcobinamide-GDP ribazoletransferase
MRSFLVAVAFLTVLPIRFGKLPDPAIVARSRFWYPLVGMLLGALLGGWAALVASWLRSPLVAAFLVLLAWVVSTGALHLDGFCDVSDGLFGGHSPEDRLRITRDPHLGTFGLAGGVLLLLAKLVFLHDLLANQRDRAPWLLGVAVAVGRCLALCVAAGARYPRPEGTGKAVISSTRWWEAVLFGGLAAGISLMAPPWSRAWAGLFLLLPALLAVGGLRWLCVRRLGGITGDCLGATIELAEAVFLLGALVLLVPAP